MDGMDTDSISHAATQYTSYSNETIEKRGKKKKKRGLGRGEVKQDNRREHVPGEIGTNSLRHFIIAQH